MTPVTELTDRAREVFRLIVENYLGSGSPVGSRTISKLPGINLSPASIRNVMQDLEEMGLLAHPHTSAGRVPTEGGLRLFVDGMMQAAEPSVEERAAIDFQTTVMARQSPHERIRRPPRVVSKSVVTGWKPAHRLPMVQALRRALRCGRFSAAGCR